MSGIEVAGLILGLFPVVVSAVDNCERSFGILADWRHFRREFAEFSNRLRGQQIILRQHIEVALRSITDSEAQLAAMMDEPGGPTWQMSVLATRLKVKLSGAGEFHTYCFTLNTVHAQLKKLNERLEVHSSIDKATVGTSKINIQKEFRKLQFCFQKKKLLEQVSIIGDQIDILGKILGNAEVLESARRTRQSTMAQVFEQVRKQASSLHRAINRAWTCSCSEKHPFELLLTRKKQRGKNKSAEQKMDRKLCVAFPFREHDGVSLSHHQSQNTFPHQLVPLTGMRHSWCTTETTMVLDLADGEQSCPGSRPDLERSCSETSTVSDTTLVRVGSENHPRKTSEVSTETLIEDLCQKIKTWENSDPFLGYLPDGLGAHHGLHVVQDLGEMARGIRRIISLRDILGGTSGDITQMSRGARMSVALTISYALLELHSSPWLQDKWDKSDIYFWVEEQGNVIAEHPFLVSLAENEKPINQDQRNAGALLSLGILIMELWFNQALETQPFWTSNFGPDGKETEFTRFSAAATWQRKVNEDAGILLHGITRRCIYGDFGLDTQDLADQNFTRAVYDGVIKELESIIRIFE
ncbi:MAG: hypothetical protein Q9172_006803 [Xanthocarpia lactea]